MKEMLKTVEVMTQSLDEAEDSILEHKGKASAF